MVFRLQTWTIRSSLLREARLLQLLWMILFPCCDDGGCCFVGAILRETTTTHSSRPNPYATKMDGYYLLCEATGFRRILFGETACDWNRFGKKRKFHQWIPSEAKRETPCCHVPWKPCEENENARCLASGIPGILFGHVGLVPHCPLIPCANDDYRHHPDFPWIPCANVD